MKEKIERRISWLKNELEENKWNKEGRVSIVSKIEELEWLVG